MNTNTKKNYTARIISICGLIFIFTFCVFMSAYKWNPDSDTYWLVETGRWIWDNKSVPKINPWNQTENLEIIVQQPLCALLNYFTVHFVKDIKYIWILAVIENILLLFCFFLLGNIISKKYYPNKKEDVLLNREISIYNILSLIIIETICGVCNMITTRPYQITLCSIILLICVLEKNLPNENYLKIGFLTAVITLFQANYQIASIYFIPLVLCCYMFGNAINKLQNNTLLKPSNLAKWITIFVVWFIFSCLNPYGFNGVTYLFKSKTAVMMFKNNIQELSSPTMNSIYFILCIAIIVLSLLSIKSQKANWSHLFIGLFSIIFTCYAKRNGWLAILTFFIMFTTLKLSQHNKEENSFLKKLKQFYNAFICTLSDKFMFLMIKDNYEIDEDNNIISIFRKMLCVIAIGTCIIISASSFYAPNDSQIEINEYISLINNLPNDAKIYTDFNTGGIVEYCQRKCYVDARPELYSISITKSNDILKEYYNLDFSTDYNYEEFLIKNNYDYAFVRKLCPFQFYLKYNGKYEMVHESDNFALYQIK